MNVFPDNIRFSHPWRSYQEQVLNKLNEFFDNGVAHIIAPPGSGKTVLGLEMMLRLNKPTVILVPTITLREQWIQRFKELFLQTNELPEWVSDNIEEPKLVTIDTYQGVHAVFRSEAGIDPLIQKLMERQVGVFIFDEAHHLKNEWWKVIFALREALNPQVVCLTATPPCDSSSSEWKNYFELAGDIDVEIQVPDLVYNKELCPHQDFIYLTYPDKKERERLEALQAKNIDLITYLQNNQAFVAVLKQHPFWLMPELDYELLYEYFESYLALLVFLKSCGEPVAPDHHKVLGTGSIPALNNAYMSRLLEFYLYEPKRFFEQHDRFVFEDIEHRLREANMLFKKRVYFEDVKQMAKYLSLSSSKMKAILKIVDMERVSKNIDGLCFLVLADYIQADAGEDESILGVVPIFEALCKQFGKVMSIAAVTGSLTIFPKETHEDFVAFFKTRYMDVPAVTEYSDSHYAIYSKSRKPGVVEAMTSLLEAGIIQGFVGTKALLGEGWDAPRLNTLILASNIGSFVSSNQMRGRAIRTSRNHPEKTAHIWHLGCVDPSEVDDGGYDISILRDRFEHFIGLELEETPVTIKSGIRRMNLPRQFTKEKVSEYNSLTFYLMQMRNMLAAQWNAVIESGHVATKGIAAVKTDEIKNLNMIYLFSNFLKFSLALVLFIVFSIYIILPFGGLILKYSDSDIVRGITGVLVIISTFGIFALYMYFFFAYWWYRDLMRDLDKVAKAVIETMKELNLISSGVMCEYRELTSIQELIIDGNMYEQNLIVKAIKELLVPIDNPRYVFERKKFAILRRRRDYHQVPEIFAGNKQTAELFMQVWRRNVGRAALIYTRNPEGHKLLMRARLKSINNKYEQDIYSYSGWE